jgi:predicted nucleic acid-binding protein
MAVILADKNIVIYTLKGIEAVKPYLDYDFALSDISVIELLGVKNIDDKTLSERKLFIDNTFNYPLNHNIRQIAISLKQSYKIKTPDTIIAATAIAFNIPLITADKDFNKTRELNAIIISL